MAWSPLFARQAKKCTLEELFTKRSVVYTGGTNKDDVEARAKGHKSALLMNGKFYYARTSRVQFQEDKLRDKFRPTAPNSGCEDRSGFVYLLCSPSAAMPKMSMVTTTKASLKARKAVKKVAAKDKCMKWGCKFKSLAAMGKGSSKRCKDHKGEHL
jgi:hypothetical protein